MKQIFVCLLAVCTLLGCNSDKKEKTAGATKTEPDGVSVTGLSMPATYSSSFKMGNPAYAASIVQGSWKDWMDDKLDNMRSWAADSIVAYHSDAKMTTGVDSLMALWKRQRAAYTDVRDTINAVMPVYSTDKNENWVLVWATAYGTKLSDGVKDTTYFMETWRINKDGKADLLFQFDRHWRKE